MSRGQWAAAGGARDTLSTEKTSLIYRKTDSLRSMQIPLGLGSRFASSEANFASVDQN